MPRATKSVASRKRRKKILKLAKGYWGRRGKIYTVAKHSVEKALLHAYRHRRNKKREFRALWITRINAGARFHNLTYSQLMSALRKKNVDINRKILADLAYNNPDAFSEIVKFAMK